MKLSIITINYNNQAGLLRTLESISRVKSDCFEYLVIDGGSTDDSLNIIKNFQYSIDYWVSEPDRGIYHAMNKGIEKASGEYLLFINSGDIINNNVQIEETLNLLTGEDIIYFNIAEIFNNGEIVIKECPDYLDFRYFILDALPHQSTFIKSNALKEYGGYSENMKIFSDWAFFMDAICKLECTYKHINQHFSSFFQDGISSMPENKVILWQELKQHVAVNYPIYNRIYKEWFDQKEELHKLRSSRSIQWLKKFGFIKWFTPYSK